MRSPVGGHELRQLEGNPSAIWTTGDGWVKLGSAMKNTATELKAIGDSDVHKSMGTDQLAEMASEASGDLEDAGVRYHDTGEVLRTYADALETAKSWLTTNMDDIIAAENSYVAAVDAKEEADDKQDDLSTTHFWEDEATDEEKSAADRAATQASSTLTTAEGNRNELWTAFDQVFQTWSDAYDDAVDGIQKAMDSAGNNDGFWEALGDLLKVIGWVIVVLTVIALIIGAPLFGVLGLIILGLTAFVFLANLLMYFNGEASLSDVIWAGVSLLPFGLGKLLGAGARVGTVVAGGRTVTTGAIRAGLPAVRLMRPTTWLTPLRSLVAPVRSWLALPRPGLFVNPFRSIALGGQEAKIATFLSTMRGSRWASNPQVASFITQNARVIPGRMEQIVNVGVFGVTFGSDLADGLGIRPDIPGAGEPEYELEWTR